MAADFSYYNQKEIKSFNGLRGIAILLVLLYHNFAYLRVSAVGWIGVDLFFVLSGFLITRILLAAKDRENYFKNFYMRRILRIFPLYYLSLVLFFLGEKIVRLPTTLTFSGDISYYLTYMQNLLFFIGAGEDNPRGILNHFWSLSVEEHFYFVWPFLVYWLKPKQLLGFGVLVIAIGKITALLMLQHGMAWVAVYSFSITRFETLIIGGLASVLVYLQVSWVKKAAKWVLAATGCALIIFWGKLLLLTKDFNSLAPELAVTIGKSIMLTILALFFASVLIFAMFPSRFQRFLCTPSLTFLGKYSYGIYVFHYPIYSIVSYYAFSKFDVQTTFGKIILLAMPIACTLVTLVVAYFSYNYFEKFFLSLKKYYPYGIAKVGYLHEK